MSPRFWAGAILILNAAFVVWGAKLTGKIYWLNVLGVVLCGLALLV